MQSWSYIKLELYKDVTARYHPYILTAAITYTEKAAAGEMLLADCTEYPWLNLRKSAVIVGLNWKFTMTLLMFITGLKLRLY